MPAGFLYVLINPTMPGLAKVGKTTRNPADRVSELSSATGVPSPFILAFQQPVDECDAAELWVHRQLESEGFRHADNREFFNAPLHEIVKAVSQAASLVFDEPILNESAFQPPDSERSNQNLAEELYSLGRAYDEGTDSILRNREKALKYYEQAAALGNRWACDSAGLLHQYGGDGVRRDLEKALAFYCKAVRLGLWFREGEIAELFFDANQVDAAQAHWKLFFEHALSPEPQDIVDHSYVGIFGLDYCVRVASGEIAHCVADLTLVHFAKSILKAIDEQIILVSQSKAAGVSYLLLRLNRARRFMEQWLPTDNEKTTRIQVVPPTPKWPMGKVLK